MLTKHFLVKINTLNKKIIISVNQLYYHSLAFSHNKWTTVYENERTSVFFLYIWDLIYFKSPRRSLWNKRKNIYIRMVMSSSSSLFLFFVAIFWVFYACFTRHFMFFFSIHPTHLLVFTTLLSACCLWGPHQQPNRDSRGMLRVIREAEDVLETVRASTLGSFEVHVKSTFKPNEWTVKKWILNCSVYLYKYINT